MPVSRRQSSGSGVDPGSLQRWSLRKLEAELANRGLADTGSKQEMIDRLVDHLTQKSSPIECQPKEIKKELKTEPESENVETETETTPKRGRKAPVAKKRTTPVSAPTLNTAKKRATGKKKTGAQSGDQADGEVVLETEIKQEPDDEPIHVEEGQSVADALRRKYSRKRATAESAEAVTVSEVIVISAEKLTPSVLSQPTTASVKSVEKTTKRKKQDTVQRSSKSSITIDAVEIPGEVSTPQNEPEISVIGESETPKTKRQRRASKETAERLEEISTTKEPRKKSLEREVDLVKKDQKGKKLDEGTTDEVKTSKKSSKVKQKDDQQSLSREIGETSTELIVKVGKKRKTVSVGSEKSSTVDSMKQRKIDHQQPEVEIITSAKKPTTNVDQKVKEQSSKKLKTVRTGSKEGQRKETPAVVDMRETGAVIAEAAGQWKAVQTSDQILAQSIQTPPAPPAQKVYVLPEIELNMAEWEIITREEIEEAKREILLAKVAERSKRAKGGGEVTGKRPTSSAKTSQNEAKEKETVEKLRTESATNKAGKGGSDYSTLPSVVAETLLGLPVKGLTIGKTQSKPPLLPLRKIPKVQKPKKTVQFAAEDTTKEISPPKQVFVTKIASVAKSAAEKSALDARIEAIFGPTNRDEDKLTEESDAGGQEEKNSTCQLREDPVAIQDEADRFLKDLQAEERSTGDSVKVATPPLDEEPSPPLEVAQFEPESLHSELINCEESQVVDACRKEPTSKYPKTENEKIITPEQISSSDIPLLEGVAQEKGHGAETVLSDSVEKTREKSAEISEKSAESSSVGNKSEKEEDEISKESSSSISGDSSSDSDESSRSRSRSSDSKSSNSETEEPAEESADSTLDDSYLHGEIRLTLPDRILTMIPSMIASAEAQRGPKVVQIPREKKGSDDEEERWAADSPETLLAKALKAAIPIGDRERDDLIEAADREERKTGERKSKEKETPPAEEEYEPEESNNRYFWRQRQREVDPEPPLDLEEVQLDSYKAHESIKVSGEGRSIGEPVISDGYALMWTGIKASYGFSTGKLAYQVKILEFMDTSSCIVDERYPHDMRIGWSIDSAPYVLSEAPHSYGYSSIAQKAENSVFLEWGESYNKDDVVTCCMDFDTGEISYFLNKQGLGTAFTVDLISLAAELGRKPVFFPHIVTKNCKFEVNFGQLGDWGPIPEEFHFVNEARKTERVRGLVTPETKKECTLLMMIGLPACGKTRFVNRYVKDHPEEKWVILSADSAMDRMKVNGIPRHRCHKGRWDILMGLTAKAVAKMLQLACRKKKNYIIDQTNVMFQSRRRKLGLFRDFSKKALVMVPSDEDFSNRRQKQIQDTNMEMPAEAMLEMKSMFLLPNLNYEFFDELVFIEPSSGDFDTDLATAQMRVERYNEEGKSWRPWQSGPVGPGPMGPRKPLASQGQLYQEHKEQRTDRGARRESEERSNDRRNSVECQIPHTRPLTVDVDQRSSASSDQTTPSTASPSPAGGTTGYSGSFRFGEKNQFGKTRYVSSFAKPGWANSKAKRGYAGFSGGQAPSFIPPPPALVKVTELGSELTPDILAVVPETESLEIDNQQEQMPEIQQISSNNMVQEQMERENLEKTSDSEPVEERKSTKTQSAATLEEVVSEPVTIEAASEDTETVRSALESVLNLLE